MQRNPDEEGARWFRQSEMDLDDAEFASNGKRFHLACFLAQQAAEKALKAYLYSKGAESVWGHSVAELCQDCSEFSWDFDGLVTRAAPLDKYYVPTRYPNGLPGGIPSQAFSVQDAQLAIGMAREVIGFVRERL